MSSRKRPPSEADRSATPPRAVGIGPDASPPLDADSSIPPTDSDRTVPATGGDRSASQFRHLEVTRSTDERLDSYLANRLRLSRTRVAAMIRQGRVRVNGESCRKSYVPLPGDRIEADLPRPRAIALSPEPIAIDIRYEDDHLAVVEKPAGMVVHPAPGHESGTLVHALLHHLGGLSGLGGDTRPGIVHRLDKDTSGLLVVARDDEAHAGLSRALSRREVRRGYIAAAWGHVDGDRLRIDRPIGRDARDRKRMAVREDGRPAITHIKRLERWPSADLLAVRLQTGRTHQVRVHLESIGHPIAGDPIYAPRWERGFVGAGGHWAEEFARRSGRLFLHAAHLSFRHPLTGEWLSFTSTLPEPLASAVEWARSGP